MGHSALCLAEGLVPDGRVITLDLNEETNKIARSYWVPLISRVSEKRTRLTFEPPSQARSTLSSIAEARSR